MSGLLAFVAMLVLIGMAGSLYLAPTIVAFGREHHQKASILVVNLFLGWTLIGWVVAFAMAVGTTHPKPPPPHYGEVWPAPSVHGSF